MSNTLRTACAAVVVMLALALPATAADDSRDAWTDRAMHSLDAAQVRPERYRALWLDVATISEFVNSEVPLGRPLSLPSPDGGYVDFVLEDAGTMEPALAAQFPEIRSLRGRDSAGNSVRVDLSSLGFQAMVFERDGGRWVVQPETLASGTDAYLSFRGDALRKQPFRCGVHDNKSTHAPLTIGPQPSTVTGTNRRTLRTAVAATGEYTAFFGGTVANGQAAVVTAMNRVNELYERDFAVHMTLVANNSSVIFTDGLTDPYSNDDGFAMLDENVATLDAVIGSANYDIGHVFSTGGGGVAEIDAICVAGSKAAGVTGSSAPVGDPFYVDYVAHEMGHQFGGEHTFNSIAGFCAGNRESPSAFEPGSGSTIMAYAGICAGDDLQSNSDAHFHAHSLEQINTLLNATSCGTVTANTNQAPVIPAFPIAPAAIPSRTPFTLVAPAVTDPDGDSLTFAWEQYDLGPSTSINVDNGLSPIIRSYNPVAGGQRTIPRLSNLLANTTAPGEILPQVARAALKFRLTVRDNRAVGGRTVSADLPPIQVIATATPFAVTSPNTAVSWPVASTQTVTWDVGGTTAAPISCASVDIALSLDGGGSFPSLLVSGTANDGSQTVTLPGSLTTTARVRVKCSTNIFFDVSNANFTISGAIVDAIFNNGFE